MRKKLIAGNWKMNLNWDEAMTLAASLERSLRTAPMPDADVALFPPALYLRPMAEYLMQQRSGIAVGAQNCSEHAVGAYTGEIAADMIRSAGGTLCLIGHSERRTLHHETGQTLRAKVNQALHAGLHVVYCCGERWEEREQGQTLNVNEGQLREGLFHLTAEQMKNVSIAYEPVWAIGTGKTATAAEAQTVHAALRVMLDQQFGAAVAEQCRILYGGSMKASNAEELLAQPDVDGGLIGGASLTATDFLAIVAAAQ